MPHPNISVAWKHVREVQGLSPRCDGVYAQQPHFIVGCVDRTQGGRCHWHENRSGDIHIHRPIGLNDNDLFVKQSLHKLLKFKEIFRHLRFMAKQINLHEFAIIINKTHVIFLIPKRSFCQAMFHKLLKFKEIFRHLRFMTKQINLHEFAIIINKTHIIFFYSQIGLW
jgi:uncharacterized protein VirK/YbjX